MEEAEINFSEIKETIVKAKKSIRKSKSKPTLEKPVEINYNQLYNVLCLAADKILHGVLKRSDVPADVLEVLEGVLHLRSLRDYLILENRINPRVALFWAEELKVWAEANTPLE